MRDTSLHCMWNLTREAIYRFLYCMPLKSRIKKHTTQMEKSVWSIGVTDLFSNKQTPPKCRKKIREISWAKVKVGKKMQMTVNEGKTFLSSLTRSLQNRNNSKAMLNWFSTEISAPTFGRTLRNEFYHNILSLLQLLYLLTSCRNKIFNCMLHDSICYFAGRSVGWSPW